MNCPGHLALEDRHHGGPLIVEPALVASARSMDWRSRVIFGRQESSTVLDELPVEFLDVFEPLPGGGGEEDPGLLVHGDDVVNVRLGDVGEARLIISEELPLRDDPVRGRLDLLR